MENHIESKNTYAYHHEIVRDGLQEFLHVAHSLFVIKEEKLFKEAGYKTFVQYCKEEHGIGKSEAYRLAGTYKIASTLGLEKKAAMAVLECPRESRDQILDTALTRSGGVSKVTRSLILDINDEIIEEAVATDLPDTSSIKGDLDIDTIRRLLELIRRSYLELKIVAEKPEGSHIPMARVESDLRNAGEAIKMSIPTKCCPVCSGHGCKLCHKTGWVPEHIWQASKDYE